MTWTIQTLGNTEAYAVIKDEGGGEIATVVTEHAPLVAAAPDLAKALVIVANCVPDMNGGTTLGTWEMQQVRLALMKAGL